MMKKIMIMTTMMITAHLAHHTVQVQAHLLQVLIVIIVQVLNLTQQIMKYLILTHGIMTN